jgi:hypothetical protein
MGEEGLLETHALHDFDSVPADVDLQTGQPEVRKLLEDGNIVLLSCEPESEGVAGQTSAADEDFQFGHVGWILGDFLFTMD